MAKKKRSASKKRLDSLLLVLLLTAVLLVMSTYAWFTANKTVNIDKINVKIATSAGLQISANGIDWKSTIDIKDLQMAGNPSHDAINGIGGYAAVINQFPEQFEPVSSPATAANGKLKMFFGNVEADLDESSADYGKFALTTRNGASYDSIEANEKDYYDNQQKGTGYYAAFDIFFRKTGGPAEDFYFSGQVKEMNYDATKAEDLRYTEIAAVADEKGIANAARVALIQGNSTAEEDTATIQALTLTDNVVYWEPNADWHSASGVANANALGFAPSSGTLSANASCSPVVLDAVKAPITSKIELSKCKTTANAAYFTQITMGGFTYQSNKGATPSMALPKAAGNALASGVTKYRVYLWIEGQDVDCEDLASGTYMSYALSFSLDPITAATP